MVVRLVQCKSAASPSKLPGLDWAINPYRGCSHSCAYCYSQDVTRFELGKPWGECVEAKVNIVQKLKKELEKGPKGVYGMGTVTDPYQPLEKKLELTRGCLSILKRADASVSVLTKSDLVLRDVDILSSWPGAEVGISIASLDDGIASLVEPGAPSPRRRFDALAKLVRERIKVFLMIAPVIPGLSDAEEDLGALVREASTCAVPTIMWDKFNPKPMATTRLRRALAAKGIELPGPHTTAETKKIRTVLSEGCAASGIELLDAF